MPDPWRWIDNADGTHVLVEGDDLLPLASAILMCGGIESSYQDRIARVPALEDACRTMERFLAQEVPDGDGTCPLSERLATLGGAIDDLAQFNRMAREIVGLKARLAAAARLLAAAKYFQRGKECYCEECKIHAAAVAEFEAGGGEGQGEGTP